MLDVNTIPQSKRLAYCIAKGAEHSYAVSSPPQTLRNAENVCAILRIRSNFVVWLWLCEVVVRDGLSHYVLSNTTSNRNDGAKLLLFFQY